MAVPAPARVSQPAVAVPVALSDSRVQVAGLAAGSVVKWRSLDQEREPALRQFSAPLSPLFVPFSVPVLVHGRVLHFQPEPVWTRTIEPEAVVLPPVFPLSPVEPNTQPEKSTR